MKTLLIDADGVAIKKHEYFSVRYARDYDIDPQVIIAFFKERYPLCATGKSDLKEELAKVLSAWKWPGTVDKLLLYWFEGERETDEAVLAKMKEWRAQGVRCFLVSDQEKYRAEYLWQTIGLREWFDGAFFSCELGYQKDTPEFFQAIGQNLATQPKGIIYFDDDLKNVETARQLGIDARLYATISDLNNPPSNNDHY